MQKLLALASTIDKLKEFQRGFDGLYNTKYSLITNDILSCRMIS